MKTAMLMAMMTALCMLVGKGLGGNGGMLYALIFGVGMNLYYYWYSDTMVLKQYEAREASPQSSPNLYSMVKRLSERAGIPMPKVYIIKTDVPNAFATGRDPEHAVVAVNTGLLNMLDADEVEGVLAHEISHIKHRDILTSTIAACMASVISYLAHIAQWAMILGGGSRDRDNEGGFGGIFAIILAPIAASIIQMAISRSREYEADKSAGEITRRPLALADALLKIEAYAKRRVMPHASEATAHMFIINPLSGVDFSSLFSTHPKTAERVARLREQALTMGK